MTNEQLEAKLAKAIFELRELEKRIGDIIHELSKEPTK